MKTLPDLPESATTGFTEDQMRERDRTIIELCVLICEARAEQFRDDGAIAGASLCATSLRALLRKDAK